MENTFLEIFQTEQSYWSVNVWLCQSDINKECRNNNNDKKNNTFWKKRKSKLLNWLITSCNLLKVKLIYLTKTWDIHGMFLSFGKWYKDCIFVSMEHINSVYTGSTCNNIFNNIFKLQLMSSVKLIIIFVVKVLPGYVLTQYNHLKSFNIKHQYS